MLILTRKAGEALMIGDDIRIVVTSIEAGQVRIGIEAPQHITVLREELLKPQGQHTTGEGSDQPSLKKNFMVSSLKRKT